MTTPVCSLSKRCGSCQYMGTSYEKQLELKMEKVRQLYPKISSIQPILGMENPVHYRCKVQAAFGWQKGKIVSGTYESASHRLVSVETCLLEDEQADAILATIRKLMLSFKLTPYNEDRRTGVLRHVLIRKGYFSGQILVVLVTGSYQFPGKNNFVNALCKAHPEITTVVHNINGAKTSMVLGSQQKTIQGPGYITDHLLGCTFRISAGSFYQVNPIQTEKLYSQALQMAGLTGTETVLDAYCGTGTIGILAAKAARSVIGVELNRQAVQDAVINARINHVENIRFVCDDAGRFLQQAVSRNAVPEVVIMDPPRAGSNEAFLSALAYASPKKVVYISCNPETQARDTAYLVKHGYAIQRIQPVDLFPMTVHVETVCQLVLRNPVVHVNIDVNVEELVQDKRGQATYVQIKDYVLEHSGLKVSSLYIAQVKQKCGIIERQNYNKPKSENARQPQCPSEKEAAIMEALKYFQMISVPRTTPAGFLLPS